jgi:hypothetical protein
LNSWDAERPRSEESNWEDPERLLWIRVNWHRVLFGKGSPGNCLEADLVRRATFNLQFAPSMTCENP